MNQDYIKRIRDNYNNNNINCNSNTNNSSRNRKILTEQQWNNYKAKKLIYQAEVEGSSCMNGESEGDVHVSSCIVASCTGEKSTLHIGEMNKGVEKAS